MNLYYMMAYHNARNQVLSDIKRTLVLDVLKPHSPPLPDFAAFLSEFDGVDKIDITVLEMDEKTETIKVVIIGSLFDYEELKAHMSKQGAVIHSVDQVIVENVK